MTSINQTILKTQDYKQCTFINHVSNIAISYYNHQFVSSLPCEHKYIHIHGHTLPHQHKYWCHKQLNHLPLTSLKRQVLGLWHYFVLNVPAFFTSSSSHKLITRFEDSYIVKQSQTDMRISYSYQYLIILFFYTVASFPWHKIDSDGYLNFLLQKSPNNSNYNHFQLLNFI